MTIDHDREEQKRLQDTIIITGAFTQQQRKGCFSLVISFELKTTVEGCINSLNLWIFHLCDMNQLKNLHHFQECKSDHMRRTRFSNRYGLKQTIIFFYNLKKKPSNYSNCQTLYFALQNFEYQETFDFAKKSRLDVIV